ncbi:facilitated trehalose transporter Tret1-2 homolog isoform X2 [Rhagoletis pomonella]|nr:facilitated trehalose transporter Tret1-2 homolog isoform X2 [Rhagoletis pomonella]XP_036326068.1 facilitated trehalose transporter Tret1-2 homolog isoform X2 [Rhagoletis pomonella]XP_036326069.1 facilitated trehalose transporter Tret1-2 homolog isoform X2 [Rhagoletis pomonella]XP_036326070.1 facilitated trehalose transporter Tret1-2 homolog isoform X2 [Rhagoletis pomonella]
MVHGTSESNSKTLPQYVAALSAAGGAFAAGTLLGWTSPAEVKINNGAYDFEVSKSEFSWVGSAMTLGAAFVCIPTGILINLVGRKLAMLLLVLPFTLGWGLLIWAQNVPMMFVARFLLGIAGGAFCVAAPMYTGEIAQKEIRGTLGSFFQLMITAGILFVYAIGAGLSVFWMSIVCGVIPLVFGVIFVFMPESPTYLVIKNKDEGAIKSIQWLRGKDYEYKAEIEELRETQLKINENQVSWWVGLSRPVTRKALLISLGLMFFQQLCGINAVIFYSAKIFEDAQTGIDANLSTIVVGIMQFIATFVSTIVVDKLGRRLLLLTSGLIMALATISMGIYFYMQDQDANSVATLGWLPVVSLCVFIVLFSLGFGPVPWLMMGEVFAADIKGVAGSIAGTTNWALAFLVTKSFVNLSDSLGKGQTFWLFSAITIIGVFFVFFIVPETKGKSLNEIQAELEGKNASTTSQAAAVNGAV